MKKWVPNTHLDHLPRLHKSIMYFEGIVLKTRTKISSFSEIRPDSLPGFLTVSFENHTQNVKGLIFPPPALSLGIFFIFPNEKKNTWKKSVVAMKEKYDTSLIQY